MAYANVNALELSILSLEISGYVISAEVAHTQLSRSQGLMYRESLEENSGMLFIFPHAGHYSMWMQNTYIPLSVAFIDEQGVILNIVDMQPQTRTAHDSAGMAKYALEMNRGWFSARKIAAGARVVGLEKAPAAN
ncbi:DUF192 domain-containing protein [Nitrosomonas sp. Nm166]|uniref:DUF192 domain-containing protein n=1 Tax=Nitrosomonas sp. Nm166 TaxID=1881054 RepID=UPI00210A60BC|nr:DUF192 domain-containing protein [Nitrosomonas sp. Nm166]